MNKLEERLERLEYHQKLLLKMVQAPDYSFYRLVIEKNLTEQEVEEFLSLCSRLNMEFKKEKEEHFVFYAPLFQDFKKQLNIRLQPKEVIEACMKQKMYPELMEALQKNLL